MKSKTRFFFIMLTAALFIIVLSNIMIADEIHMPGGHIIRGEIISQESDAVIIMKENGESVTIPADRVEKIAKSSVAPSPTPEKRKKINRPVADSPEIMKDYDAVLFGVMEKVYVRPEGGIWIDAAENMQVKINDQVRTSLGKTKIKLRGRGEVRLPPNSQLVVKAIDEKQNKVTIELRSGRIWNNITPGAGMVNYSIETPDLVAGVRGTLFKVSLNEAAGSRVAVFDGSVYASLVKGGPEVTLTKNLAIATDEQGDFTKKHAVDPEEIDEWNEWDQWALEVHEQIASRFIFGGEQIDQMAKLVAEDQKRYEKIVNEANARILVNKEADRIAGYSQPFLEFARDTGVIPNQNYGFRVLIKDPGIPGWEGPYIEEDALPLTDRWGQPLRYELKTSAASGNTYGVVYSTGPDQTDQQAAPTSDDLKVIIPYYKLNI